MLDAEVINDAVPAATAQPSMVLHEMLLIAAKLPS